MYLSLLYILLGGVLLTYGADLLVSGAASVARRAGISALVIGLTIVSYGTSLPELAVSMKAAIDGSSDIALGNVVGSNICNVLLILGLASLFARLSVHRQLIRKEVPVMIGLSALLFLVADDGVISRIDGIAFSCGLVLYSVLAVRAGRREGSGEASADSSKIFSLGKSLGFILGGMILLVLGSKFFVDGASDLARLFGISELLIGLTVVALGTSLPEVVTSVVAAMRGNGDIAIGNVVGSSIFNILSVLGISATITPMTVDPAALQVDIPVMVLTAAACFPIFLRDEVTFLEGLFFLLNYAVYLTYLVLSGLQHPASPAFSTFALYVVVPTSSVILIGALMYHVLCRRNPTEPINEAH